MIIPIYTVLATSYNYSRDWLNIQQGCSNRLCNHVILSALTLRPSILYHSQQFGLVELVVVQLEQVSVLVGNVGTAGLSLQVASGIHLNKQRGLSEVVPLYGF